MTTEDKMVGWQHKHNGHEFEYTPGVGDGQGGLACCSPWGCRVRHNLATKQRTTTIVKVIKHALKVINFHHAL